MSEPVAINPNRNYGNTLALTAEQEVQTRFFLSRGNTLSLRQLYFCRVRRFVSSILAILVLVLSCITCSESEAMSQGSLRAETVINAAPDHDCAGEGFCSACSPFCSCSCCYGFVIPYNSDLQPQTVAVFEEKQFTAYHQRRIAEIFLPIWQPPQLV